MTFRELHWLWFILFSWIALIGPGRIEGTLFPTAAPMVLTKVEQTEFTHPLSGKTEPAIYVWGDSARLRPNCKYRRIDWFKGDRDANNVPVGFEPGESVVRKDGEFSFGPWFVAVNDRKELTRNSFSDVFHRCYYFGIPSFWLTRSPFWR